MCTILSFPRSRQWEVIGTSGYFLKRNRPLSETEAAALKLVAQRQEDENPSLDVYDGRIPRYVRKYWPDAVARVGDDTLDDAAIDFAIELGVTPPELDSVA